MASTATFGVNLNSTATFKDLVVNGDTQLPKFGTLQLVGDVDFNGQVLSPFGGILSFGHFTRYTGLPLSIHSANFDLNSSIITGQTLAQVPSVTLDSDVILRGRSDSASFTQPLTNNGQIIADRTNQFASGEVFNFTAAPITNLGSLSAVNKSILRIANLAAANTGTVAAAAGSSVQFTSTFADASTGTVHVDVAGNAATQFGLIAVTGAATLAGTLDVQFATGFTPAVGSTYKVMTYGSHTGQFDTVHVTGLAGGLIVTPTYNGGDLTLVVSAASGLMALILPSTTPASSTGASSMAARLDQLFASYSRTAGPQSNAISTARLRDIVGQSN